MDTQIHIRKRTDSSIQEGPFTQGEFLELIERGQIGFGDYAWKTGLEHWVLAGSLALAFRKKTTGVATTPPDLAFGETLPSGEAEQRELFLRVDRVRLFPGVPPECVDTATPLSLVLSPSIQMPGGKLWRRLATELTRLFAARVRFEQAGLLHPHPLRALLGDRNLDNDLADDEIALLAWEEMKRRAVALGADLLVDCRVSFEFVTDHSQPNRPTLPLAIVAAVPGYSEEAVEVRQAKLPVHTASDTEPHAEEEAAELNALKAKLAERERQIEEREAFLMDAEARLMNKIDEQQIKEVELEQREDDLRARESNTP